MAEQGARKEWMKAELEDDVGFDWATWASEEEDTGGHLKDKSWKEIAASYSRIRPF